VRLIISILTGSRPVIPYTNLFKVNGFDDRQAPETRHSLVHGNVTKLEPRRVFFDHLDERRSAIGPGFVDFDYLIYALGATLPPPIDVWSAAPDLPVSLLPPRAVLSL
jgi:hypothetical protein